MVVEQQPEDGPPATLPARSARPPLWLIAVQAILSLAVIGAVVTAALLLRDQHPRVIQLAHPDATEDALIVDDSTAAVQPASGQDGSLGAIGHGAPQIGKPAPDFALLDLQGRRVQLSELQGKVVVVNFWATWCGPCRQEFPELQRVAASMNEDVVVLALDQAESSGRVSQYRDQLGATFSILLDSRAEVAKSYLLTGIPDTIIVDRHGIVSDVSLGPLSAGSFRYKISQALKAP